MDFSEARTENRYFLEPQNLVLLQDDLQQRDWRVSREQNLETLYLVRGEAYPAQWNQSMRVRVRDSIGPTLFTGKQGEFMFKDMTSGAKQIVEAPLHSLFDLSSNPQLAELTTMYLAGHGLSQTQFSLASQRVHYVPPVCVADGIVKAYYPRITADTNYALNVFEKGVKTNSIPFGWVKVEAKALEADHTNPWLMHALLCSIGARQIETRFIAEQISTILASQEINITEI